MEITYDDFDNWMSEATAVEIDGSFVIYPPGDMDG